MLRTVNLRALLITLTVAVVLIGGSVAIHELQVDRQADAFLAQAQRVYAQGKSSEAIGYYRRYLRLNPDDVESMAMLGNLLADAGRLAEAQRILGQVVQRESGRAEERKLLVEVAIRRGRFQDALYHLDEHLIDGDLVAHVRASDVRADSVEPDPQTAELLDLKGVCQAQLGNYEEAEQTFRDAQKVDPGRLETIENLAALHVDDRRSRQQFDTAVEELKQAVTAHPDRYEAYLIRAQFYQRHRDEPALHREVVKLEESTDETDPIALLQQRIHEDAQLALELSLPEFEAATAALGEAERGVEAAEQYATGLWESENSDAAERSGANSELQQARRDLATQEETINRLQLVKLFAANAAVGVLQLDLADSIAQQLIDSGFESPLPYSLRADIAIRKDDSDAAIAHLEAGLEQFPGSEDLLWALASVRIAQGLDEETDALIGALEDIEGMDPLVRFLNARIEMQKQNWEPAQLALEGVRAELRRWPEIAKQADLFLGQCYGQLREVDSQIAAFERAKRADPTWIAPRLGLAAVYYSQELYDRAFEEYRELHQNYDRVPLLVGLQFVRTWMRTNFGLDGVRQQKGWNDIEALLANLGGQIDQLPKESDGETSEQRRELKLAHSVLLAEVQLAKGQPDAARQTLTAARDEYPHEISTWTRLIALEENLKNEAAVDQLLDAAEQQFGDVLQLRLTRVRIAVLRRSEDVATVLQSLSELPEESEYTQEERDRLAGAIAVSASRVGAFELAQTLCEQLTDSQPDNLFARLLMFDLALESENKEKMSEILVEVKAIDGAGAAWHYGSAVLEYLEARELDPMSPEIEVHCADAVSHLESATKIRPDWDALPKLRGEIELLRENPNRAAEYFRESIELGNRDPQLIGQVVALLHSAGRYLEADRELALLQQQAIPFSNEFRRLAADVSLRVEDYVDASRYALQVAQDSDEYEVLVWAGQVAGRSNDEQVQQEAARLLNSAIALAPDRPAAWVASIQSHVSRGQLEDARQRLEEAASAIAEEDRPLALGQAYEITGQLEQAEEQYVLAVQADPVKPSALLEASRFYRVNRRPQDAEPLLRRLLSPEMAEEGVNLPQIRRDLGVILIARGNYASLQEAAQLAQLNLNESTGNPAAADHRLLGLAYAGRPERAMRQKAIEQFEAVVGTPDETLEDKYTLARLLGAAGDRQASMQLLSDVASPSDARPQHVRAYVVALVEEGRPGEARVWLQKLNRLAPASLQDVLLRVRVLVALGDFETAHQVITGQIVDSAATDAVSRNVIASAQLAALHDQLTTDDSTLASELLSEAEALLRDPLVQESELSLELASFLAGQDRMAEALAHIETRAEEVPDHRLARAAETLMLSFEDPDHLERMAGVLSKVLKGNPDSGLLRLALADVQNWLGQYAEAEANYRLVLEQSPENVNALNNLAFLLAIQNRDLEEADALIRKSLELMGPQPALLDSHALVLMAKRHYAEAENVLSQAIEDAPGNALYRMHQAEAQMALKRLGDAQQNLQLAQSYGVADLPLHPSDRQRLQQLESQL